MVAGTIATRNRQEGYRIGLLRLFGRCLAGRRAAVHRRRGSLARLWVPLANGVATAPVFANHRRGGIGGALGTGRSWTARTSN